MRVEVTSVLSVLASGLKPEMLDRITAEVTHRNPAFFKARAMGFRWTKEPPTIQSFRWETRGLDKWLVIPRGRTSIFRQLAFESGVELELVDLRTEGDPSMANQFPQHRVTLRPHQVDLVASVMEREQGVIRAPTGSGKTTGGIAAIQLAQLPSLVIVWNARLADQWIERAQVELGLGAKDVGLVGNGVTRWRPLTIAMAPTLAKDRAKLKRAATDYGFVLCDELQRFAANTFNQVVEPMTARFRVGLSADETRKDKREFLIYDQFGQVLLEIDRKKLEASEIVLPVDVVCVPTEFTASWYVESLESEDSNERPDFTRLVEAMSLDEARNELAIKVALSAHTPALVLTHRVNHAIELRAQLVERSRISGLMIGGKPNEAEFEDTKAGLKSLRIRYGVGTYQATGTGLDLPSLKAGVCTTPIHANRQNFGQIRGRLCRATKDKTAATMFILWDRHVFGDTPVQNFLKWNDRRVHVLSDGVLVPAREFLNRGK